MQLKVGIFCFLQFFSLYAMQYVTNNPDLRNLFKARLLVQCNEINDEANKTLNKYLNMKDAAICRGVLLLLVEYVKKNEHCECAQEKALDTLKNSFDRGSLIAALQLVKALIVKNEIYNLSSVLNAVFVKDLLNQDDRKSVDEEIIRIIWHIANKNYDITPYFSLLELMTKKYINVGKSINFYEHMNFLYEKLIEKKYYNCAWTYIKNCLSVIQEDYLEKLLRHIEQLLQDSLDHKIEIRRTIINLLRYPLPVDFRISLNRLRLKYSLIDFL